MIKAPFFWMLIVLATISWIGWYIVLHNISPIQSPEMAYPLMYAMLFFSLLFTGSLLIGLLWKAIVPTKSFHFCLKRGIREGGLIAFGACITVFFLQYQSLSLNNGIIIALMVILTEAFFLINTE